MIAHHKRTLIATSGIGLAIAIFSIILVITFQQDTLAYSSANITPTASLENSPETINPSNAQNLVEIDRLGRGTITDIAWSPDGQLLAVSSQVGVEIFDANQLGSPAIIVLPRYLNGTNTIAFSPDGRLLATGSGAFPFGDFDEDNAVQMWDTSAWQVKYTFVAHETPVYDIEFSPDGTVFATSSNYEVRVWDTSTGTDRVSFWGKSNPLAFSPIDNQLALTSETSTEIWDYASVELLFTLDNPSGESWSMAFSPDGEILAVVADTIRLWDVEQQEIFDTFPGQLSVVFSPDGTQLIYFDPEFRIVAYDMISQEHRQIAEESILTTKLAFKPNTDILALAIFGGEIALLDTLTGETTTYHSGYQYPITSLVFDADGTHLSAAGTNPSSADSRIFGTAARQWNISTHEDVILAENESLVSIVVFVSPSNTPIILGSDLYQETVWDVPTDTLLIDLMGYGLVSNIAVDPNGDTVAIGVNDLTFRLYEISTGTEVYRSSRLPSYIQNLAFNQDGTLLAIGQDNGMISVFNVEEQRIVHEFTYVGVLTDPTLSFGADSFLAAGDIGSIELWDFRTEELLFLNEGGRYVTALTFSSDGSILVVGDINGIITLFDTADGSELISIQAHSPEIGAITAITFNPEDTMIAAGSNDGTISLWGIPPN